MKKLFTTTGGHWPFLSPDGRYCVAGNGVLKLIDLGVSPPTERPIARQLKGFHRPGWWSNTELLIQNDEGAPNNPGDGYLYKLDVLTDTLTVFRAGNYRGSLFRAWKGHWMLIKGRAANLVLDDIDFGPNHFGSDLSEVYAACNYDQESRLRLVDVKTRIITDVVPKVGPHVVKVSRDYVACGYFGPSNLRLPDGRQGFVNLTSGEGPAKVVFGPGDVKWVVTGVEIGGVAYCFCRPLGHTQATAVVIPHAGNALHAIEVGSAFRVACDTTSGHLEIWEGTFTDPLVPIPTAAPPVTPQPPIVKPDPPRATISKYDPKNGEAPLVCTITWQRGPNSGPIDDVFFLARERGHQTWKNLTPDGHPVDDATYQHEFGAGEWEIALKTVGPGGTDQTSLQRIVIATKPVEPPIEPPVEPPIEPPVEPPATDVPVYDHFVQVECPHVATTFTESHPEHAAPEPANMGHNSYRRLAQGWTEDEVQEGIVNPDATYHKAPWFGWVPVEYDPFLVESQEVADAYRSINPAPGIPIPDQMGHTAWRRFAEFWTHRDILHDIKGEPLEDGGHHGEKPPGPINPPTGIARLGIVRASGRRFVDDTGVFNPLGGTLMWAMRGWKYERDRVKQNMGYLASKGFDYQRILAQVGWAGNEISETWPDHVQILSEVIDYGYEIGLRTQVTGIGGGNYDGNRIITNMIAAQRGREWKVIYDEVVNEWYGNFDGSETAMKALGKKLKSSLPNLVALSAPKEEMATDRTDPWVSGGYASMGTAHLDRSDSKADWKWRHGRKPWEPRNPGYPFAHGEPGGPLSSVASFMEPIHLVMSRAVGILCGYEAYCLHNGAGVSGQIDEKHHRPANLWEVPGIDEKMQVVRALDSLLPPTPSKGTATRSGLGPHPLTSDLFWPDHSEYDHGIVRDYARVNGHEFWQCLQGIKNYVNVKANRGYRLTFINPVSHEQHERLVGGGQTIRVDRGAVDTRGYGAWIVRGVNA